MPLLLPYGAEAGNGVVLITTKKGTVGSGKITYDFQYAIESLAKKPKLLNAEEYIQYMKEGKTFTEDFLLKNWDGTTNTSWVDAIYGGVRCRSTTWALWVVTKMATTIFRLLILTMMVW